MRRLNARWVWLFMLAMGFATLVGAANDLEGRWKLAGDGTCYLDRTDSGPDQCSPMPGRWKLGGDGSCQWDDDDSGPNQCDPTVPGLVAAGDALAADHVINEGAEPLDYGAKMQPMSLPSVG